jgi:hypothetical protein
MTVDEQEVLLVEALLNEADPTASRVLREAAFDTALLLRQLVDLLGDEILPHLDAEADERATFWWALGRVLVRRGGIQWLS